MVGIHSATAENRR